MKIKIKTPLWTGDIDSRSDMLQSTGIIGSLRWWTEVIIRGIGKFACDPSGDERCPKDKEYCPVCLVYGATGIRRLFRLKISGGEKVFNGGTINIRPNNRNRGWYLGSGLIGELDLQVIQLDRNYDENLVLIPLSIAANWGGLGAKTQHGYGVVEFENKGELKFENFQNVLNKILEEERLKNLSIKERNETNNTLPDLKEIFFAKVQFEVDNNDWWREIDGIRQALNPRDRHGNIDQGMQRRNEEILGAWYTSNSLPIASAIKNWLRYQDGVRLWKTNNRNRDGEIENWLFGTIRNNKSASKINISCAYEIGSTTWEFRIWGWIPIKENPDGFNRENFLTALKERLNGIMPWTQLLGHKTKNHKLIDWREFNSPRDTVNKEKDIHNYLQSLLEHKGGT